MKTLRMFVKCTSRPERLCAITDGVYAIALTLLVLDLKVPEIPGITNPQLRANLLQQLPNFAAYIIGFLVVAFFWRSHHRVFQTVTACDDRALRLNFFHLLFISLTPYAASLIGHYEGDRIATIVFSANLGLAALSMIRLGTYVQSKDEWRTDDPGAVWVTVPWWIIYAGPGLALVSIVVSFISIEVALLLWLLLPLRERSALGRVSSGSSPITNLRSSD